MAVALETPPLSADPELAQYLMRQLLEICTAMEGLRQFEPRNVVPEKPAVGLVGYFIAGAHPNITQEGLWVYKSSGWTQIA